MKDKRNVLLSLVMGVAMAIIWSTAFVSLLDSPAGIGVGAAPVGIQSGFRRYFL